MKYSRYFAIATIILSLFTSINGQCTSLTETPCGVDVSCVWIAAAKLCIGTDCADSCVECVGFSDCNASPANCLWDEECLQLTEDPTTDPTTEPTTEPTTDPTTTSPTHNPTKIPTNIPTNVPTILPTNIPTIFPSELPTDAPSNVIIAEIETTYILFESKKHNGENG
eukprot:61_1